jgi:transcription antitermination factor NusG
MQLHTDSGPSDWFAIQVWTGRERVSAEHLGVRGYEVFLPMYREQRRWADRVKIVERALFAGYIFCRFDGVAVGKIVTTPGVRKVLTDGSRPVPVSRDEVEAIRRVASIGLEMEPWQYLQVGHRVRVAIGPLQGTEGIVLRVKNRHRLILSMGVLQRSVSVEVETEWLRALPAVAN